MRRKYKNRVISFILWIIILLFAAWYITEVLYPPYPPQPTETALATETKAATFTPTSTQEPTQQPSPTPTIPPTDKPTETQAPTQTPLPTVTETPEPEYTPTPLPVLYKSVEDKEPVCMTFFIRPWGIKMIPRCWLPSMSGKFTGSPIFIP